MYRVSLYLDFRTKENRDKMAVEFKKTIDDAKSTLQWLDGQIDSTEYDDVTKQYRDEKQVTTKVMN